MCSSCIESPKGHIPGKRDAFKLPAQNICLAVNHEEEVEDSEEDMHCIEDSIRADVVLQLVDEHEGSALEEKVEDDGGVEQCLLGEGQKVPAPPDWISGM